MTQPTSYTPATDFSDDELSNVGGRSTVRTAQLDAELAAVATTLGGVLTNLSLNQRDDGDIRDGRVKLHTLSSDVRALLATTSATPRGAWVTATAYVVGDLVLQSTNTYICAVSHTAGTFATDLAAVKWMVVSLGSAVEADSVQFTPTATLAATNVQAAIEEADTENRAFVTRLASSAVGWGSKLVAYILRKTGAVARWVEDKLAERISLLDFGAVGDGVTDNSTAIANWKAALSKGVIAGETRRARGYVPAGVYAYSTPIVFDGDDGWDIVGDGELNSVLYCTATTGDAVTFETNVFNFEGIGIYASPARQAGSGDGLVINAGLTTTSARGTARNVHVLNQPGLGVKGFRIEHHNFDKVWASFCGGGGFILDSVTSSAAWNTFTNCRSYGCSGKPWELTALTANNVLENCEALQWTGADEGFVIDGRSNILINPDAENKDNVTGATSYKGVVLSGSRHRLLGGYIGGVNTGISLESAALCKIEQPLITNSGTAVTGTNAIVEDSSSFWNDIEITNAFTQFTNVLSPATGRAGDRVRIGSYVVSPPTAERFVAASTSSGTYTPDLTQFTSFVLTLGANTTIEFPTGLVSGMSPKFTFVQGGAGGYTVTFNGAYLHNWSNTGNTVGKWSSIGFFIESGSAIRQSGAQSAYI